MRTQIINANIILQDGIPVVLENGVAKLLDRTSFAGSVATMDRLLRVMHRHAGIDLVSVSKMLSGVPARVMGYTDRGMIRVGKRADLLLMDQELQINKIIFGGEIK